MKYMKCFHKIVVQTFYHAHSSLSFFFKGSNCKDNNGTVYFHNNNYMYLSEKGMTSYLVHTSLKKAGKDTIYYS